MLCHKVEYSLPIVIFESIMSSICIIVILINVDIYNYKLLNNTNALNLDLLAFNMVQYYINTTL